MKKRLFSALFAAFSVASAFSQIDWQFTGGPEGGDFSVVCFDDSAAYFSDDQSLFRTSDAQKWERLPFGNFFKLAASPQKIAGFRNRRYNGATRTTSLTFSVSSDRGATWLEGSAAAFDSFGVQKIAVREADIFVVSGGSQLFQTQDDGLTWDAVPLPTQFCHDVWAVGNELFISFVAKIWRQTPGGWEQIGPLPLDSFTVESFFGEGQTLFAATIKNLWASSDGGATWAQKALTNAYRPSEFVRVGSKMFIGTRHDGLLFTEDLGKTWQTASAQPFEKIARAAGKLVAAERGPGAARLNETTGALEPFSDGLASATVFDLEFAGKKAWAACENGIFSLDSLGGKWAKKWGGPEAAFLKDLEISPSGRLAVLFSAAVSPQIWVSDTSATVWDPASTNYPAGELSKIEWIGENLHVSNASFHTKTSVDFGQTWGQLKLGPLVTVAFKGKTYGLSGSKIYSSTDAGLTWQTVVSSPFPPPFPQNFNFFYGLFATAERLFVQFDDPRMLYFSTDGESWHWAGDGLPGGGFRDWVFYDEPYFPTLFERGGRHFFYGPDMGFFTSLDTLKTWLPVDPISYKCLAVGDSTLFSGFLAGGVLAAPFPKNYGAISRGHVFNDANSNGLFDVGEKPLSNVQIRATGRNFWSYNSNLNGFYEIRTTKNAGDTLRPLPFSKWVDGVFPPFRLVDSSGDGRDFGLHFQPNITDARLLGWQSRPRPGFDVWAQIQFENAGTLPIAGTVGVRIDPNFEFEKAVPQPTGLVGSDSLFWTLSSLELFEKGVIQLFGKTKNDAPLGQPFRLRGSFSTAAADAFGSDNFFEKVDTIRGAFDPNEKRVEPAAGLTKAEIAAGRPLFYEILFQNTGNFEADRVRITDQLDTALDWTTLRFVASSHPITSFRLLAGGLLEADFQGIALPDSGANEAASHGFLRFSIERKKAFGPGDAVQNRASIYFDFNEPIITNTVQSPIIEPMTAAFEPFLEAEKAAFLTISPVPATDFLTVETLGKLTGPGRLDFFDEKGATVLTLLVAEAARPVRVPAARLGAGFLAVRFSTEKGAMVGKALVAGR